MAQLIGLSPTQVKIWFQNHRYKAKKGDADARQSPRTTAAAESGGNRHLLTMDSDGDRRTTKPMRVNGDDTLSTRRRVTHKTENAATTSSRCYDVSVMFNNVGATCNVLAAATDVQSQPKSMQPHLTCSMYHDHHQLQNTSLTELTPVHMVALDAVANAASVSRSSHGTSCNNDCALPGLYPLSFSVPPSYCSNSEYMHMTPYAPVASVTASEPAYAAFISGPTW